MTFYRPHDQSVWVFFFIAAAASTVGLAWAFCYGGIEGPIDWAMNTAPHASRDRRRVALTFDDGPDSTHTPVLLDLLKALNVKATFFVVGAKVDAHPALVARIADEGHELGNHTYTHRYLPLARSKSVEAELRETDAAIVRATGLTTAVARPPYGGRSPRNVRVFERLAKRLVTWDVNSFDWKRKPPHEVAARVIHRVRPGSIVLMHDVCDRTLETVELVVAALRAEGYELVTVSEALQHQGADA